MIQVLKCPAELTLRPLHKLTFLAGGISNCPDWQNEFVTVSRLLYENVAIRTLIDPRRDNFDMSNLKMTEEQIAWEYKYLRLADSIVFWFPKETLCPIALFELGSALERKEQVFIGCHPEYKRKIDLIYQLKNRRSDIQLVHTLGELVEQTFTL